MVLFYGFFEAEESFNNRNEECESLATAGACGNDGSKRTALADHPHDSLCGPDLELR